MGIGSGRKPGVGDYEKNKKKGVCPICGDEFTGRSNKKYCQPSCNSMAWLIRKRREKLMNEIKPERIELIKKTLSLIEGFDEYEAEYFFKALARQSHDHEVKAFIEGAK